MKFIIKLLVSVVILFLIFRSIDTGVVFTTLIGIDPKLVVFALMLQICSTFIASYRWFLIMRTLQFGQDFSFYLQSYFKGTFFNQGLPTSIGGDAFRVIDVARLGFRKREAFYGVFIDRIVGLLGLLLLNALASFMGPAWLPSSVFVAINSVVVLAILSMLVLTQLYKVSALEHYVTLKPLAELSRRLVTVYQNRQQATIQLVLSVVIHLLAIMSIYFLGKGVGLTDSLVTFLLIVPPVILLTLIPISLAGWGVREGALIGLFALVGADQVKVLSMSVLYGMVMLVSSLLGLVFYLRSKREL